MLRAENAQLREANERLRMLGGDKDAVIADLRARNAELEERVARLERLISRNSGNSSMPPSADDQPGTVTYGLNFQAWCVFLLVMHHVPVERCADILESMSGTRPSGGWVHTLLDRAARAVAAANKAIRALIILARVVCGDETPLRAGPGPKTRKKYLQVACTSLLTYYFPGGRDLVSPACFPEAT